MATQGYDLYTVGQAHGGVMLPVHDGVATVDGDVQLVVRTDNPFPYGQDIGGGPVWPRGMDRLVSYYFPFLDNCQQRVDRYWQTRPEALRSPDHIRQITDMGGNQMWLDSQPYQVLLTEGDRLIGIHWGDSTFVLIVRNGVVMAGVREDTLPQWVVDAGHCDEEVMRFERLIAVDPEAQANPLQAAFDYAGRVYDRSTDEGKVKSGALVRKLRPIYQEYDSLIDRGLS